MVKGFDNHSVSHQVETSILDETYCSCSKEQCTNQSSGVTLSTAFATATATQAQPSLPNTISSVLQCTSHAFAPVATSISSPQANSVLSAVLQNPQASPHFISSSTSTSPAVNDVVNPSPLTPSGVVGNNGSVKETAANDMLHMKAQSTFNNNINLPGFIVYDHRKQSLLADRYVQSFLPIPQEFIGQFVPLRKFLRCCDSSFVAFAFKKLKLLRRPIACFKSWQCRTSNCPLHFAMSKRLMCSCPALTRFENVGGTNIMYFSIKPKHGRSANIPIYINATAYFDEVCPQEDVKDNPSASVTSHEHKFNHFNTRHEVDGKIYELSSISFNLSHINSPLFNHLPQLVLDRGYYDFSPSRNYGEYSPVYYKILGYDENDGHFVTTAEQWEKCIVHPDDHNVVREHYNIFTTDKYGDSYEINYRAIRKNGTAMWTKNVGMVVARNEHKQADRIIGVAIDINRVVDSYESLRNKVYTDILTGLHNRTYLLSRIPNYTLMHMQPLSIIFADITALKVYNDYLSHIIGDRLLCTSANIMRDCIKHEKDLIRISGDEVVCVLPQCTTEQLKAIEDDISNVLAEYNKEAPVRMPVFFNYGSATLDLRKVDEQAFSIDPKLKDKLFHKTIEVADKRMQFRKKMCKHAQYEYVKKYIELSLHHSIEIHDKRLFNN